MIPTAIKQAIVIHHYIQTMEAKDEKNTLRVEHYKMLKKMVKKFIKLHKNSDDCLIASSVEQLELDVNKIDRHNIVTVDLEIKTQFHVTIQADHDELDPEGMPAPYYYGEVLTELIA